MVSQVRVGRPRSARGLHPWLWSLDVSKSRQGFTPLATSVPSLSGLLISQPRRGETAVARGVSPWRGL